MSTQGAWRHGGACSPWRPCDIGGCAPGLLHLPWHPLPSGLAMRPVQARACGTGTSQPVASHAPPMPPPVAWGHLNLWPPMHAGALASLCPGVYRRAPCGPAPSHVPTASVLPGSAVPQPSHADGYRRHLQRGGPRGATPRYPLPAFPPACPPLLWPFRASPPPTCPSRASPRSPLPLPGL